MKQLAFKRSAIKRSKNVIYISIFQVVVIGGSWSMMIGSIFDLLHLHSEFIAVTEETTKVTVTSVESIFGKDKSAKSS